MYVCVWLVGRVYQTNKCQNWNWQPVTSAQRHKDNSQYTYSGSYCTHILTSRQGFQPADTQPYIHAYIQTKCEFMHASATLGLNGGMVNKNSADNKSGSDTLIFAFLCFPHFPQLHTCATTCVRMCYYFNFIRFDFCVRIFGGIVVKLVTYVMSLQHISQLVSWNGYRAGQFDRQFIWWFGRWKRGIFDGAL